MRRPRKAPAKSSRRRCWNYGVRPSGWNGKRLCYRLAEEGRDICSTCAIGGMDPG